jgi:hypothetical protein
MIDPVRIWQELATAEGWVDVCAFAERLNTITASWPQAEQDQAIERFNDVLKEKGVFRYQR